MHRVQEARRRACKVLVEPKATSAPQVHRVLVAWTVYRVQEALVLMLRVLLVPKVKQVLPVSKAQEARRQACKVLVERKATSAPQVHRVLVAWTVFKVRGVPTPMSGVPQAHKAQRVPQACKAQGERHRVYKVLRVPKAESV